MPLPPRGTVIRAQEAPFQPLEGASGRIISILGYGNQGRAHALNLRDSGSKIVVGGRSGSEARARAEEEGFETFDLADAARQADLVVIALPDEVHGRVWRSSLAEAIRPGQVIGVVHGFSLHHRDIDPPDGVGAVLVAPKGPGRTVRERYLLGQGIPAIIAVHREIEVAATEHAAVTDATGLALAWASGIGCTRGGSIVGSIADETETDLFGEQAVLCGGMTALFLAAFEILVEAGYPPEIAYIECCHEAKQIGDLVYSRGIAGMRAAISNTAEFGIDHAGPQLVDEKTRATMRALLQEIREGGFARRLRRDAENDFQDLHAHRDAQRHHAIEAAGETVRDLMPWLAEEERRSQAAGSDSADDEEERGSSRA